MGRLSWRNHPKKSSPESKLRPWKRLRSSNLCLILIKVLEETWDGKETTFENILIGKMHFEYWAG